MKSTFSSQSLCPRRDIRVPAGSSGAIPQPPFAGLQGRIPIRIVGTLRKAENVRKRNRRGGEGAAIAIGGLPECDGVAMCRAEVMQVGGLTRSLHLRRQPRKRKPLLGRM